MRRDLRWPSGWARTARSSALTDVEGNIDVTRTRRLVDLVRPMTITFHRAFDMAVDRFRKRSTKFVRQALIRLLTSGGEPTPPPGQEEIRKLVEQCRGRIIIVAGGGIKRKTCARTHWRLRDSRGLTQRPAAPRRTEPCGCRWDRPMAASTSASWLRKRSKNCAGSCRTESLVTFVRTRRLLSSD